MNSSNAVEYLLTVVLLSIVSNGSFSQDYCKSQLCDNNSNHIACNNTGAFSRRCGEKFRLLNLTMYERNLILNLHNSKRNSVALGQIGRLPEAERMVRLKWGKELQKLAEYNVKQCKVLHDSCRNTEKFPNVGQNIGIRKMYPKFKPHDETIEYIIDEWFDEFKNCNQSIISQFRKDPRKKFGHFTTLVNDHSTRVGCAISLYRSGPRQLKTFLMTCNYSSTNFRNRPVYGSGPVGSKCTTGISKRYRGLCSRNEDRFLNPI